MCEVKNQRGLISLMALTQNYFVLAFRRVYKEHLGLSSKVVIGYQAHADTATKSGSLMKNRFIV